MKSIELHIGQMMVGFIVHILVTLLSIQTVSGLFNVPFHTIVSCKDLNLCGNTKQRGKNYTKFSRGHCQLPPHGEVDNFLCVLMCTVLLLSIPFIENNEVLCVTFLSLTFSNFIYYCNVPRATQLPRVCSSQPYGSSTPCMFVIIYARGHVTGDSKIKSEGKVFLLFSFFPLLSWCCHNIDVLLANAKLSPTLNSFVLSLTGISRRKSNIGK